MKRGRVNAFESRHQGFKGDSYSYDLEILNLTTKDQQSPTTSTDHRLRGEKKTKRRIYPG